nr:cystatin-like protein [Misgurnus anguillicaudatus]
MSYDLPVLYKIGEQTAHQIRSVYLCRMRGLLWLVGAVLLLGSIDGGDTYEQLDDDVKKIVDKAIIKANEKYGKKYHIDFHSIKCSDNSRLFHVQLKPTSCGKGPRVHRKECTLQDDPKPWVSCVACGVNIACEPVRNQKKINELIKKCGSECKTATYLAGAANLGFLKQKGKEFGCLGCI